MFHFFVKTLYTEAEEETMELVDAVVTRRSVREYDPRPIDEKDLTTILDVTRFAPSGSNREPTRLIVIRDPQRRKSLAQLCSGQKFVGEAPIIIAVVIKTIDANRGNYMGSSSSLVDGAIVLDHLTLIARSFNLGTCWIGAFDNAQVKQFLGIPDDWNVVGLTPLGYPKTDHAFSTTTRRMPLSDFVMEERWESR